MGIVYLNNEDYYRFLIKAKESGKPISHIVKQELHKPPEVKEIVKEVVKEIDRHYYFEKLKGERKEHWHEYKFNEKGEPVLVE